MTDPDCWRITWRIAIDVLELFLAFLPFILLTGIGAQPFQRGFFCDDESIRYPHRPDTVGPPRLFTGTLLISTAIILIVEMSRYIYFKCTSNEPTPYHLTSKCSVPSIVFILYRVLGSLYFGFAVTLSLIDVGKFSSGRLKPNFVDVCRPDPTSYNCTSSESSQRVYVESFRCLGTNKFAIWNSRLSFPSVHSTISSYFAVFLLIYLQVRLTWRPIKMLRHVLQAACYAAVIFISISRVNDNAHHWSDIIAGIILGTVVGILVILFVCRIFQLASDSVQEKKLLQQEIIVTEASGVNVHPVAEALTLPTPIEFPKTSVAHLPVYNGGCENMYGFCGNGGRLTTAFNSSVQQPYGIRSNFVHNT